MVQELPNAIGESTPVRPLAEGWHVAHSTICQRRLTGLFLIVLTHWGAEATFDDDCIGPVGQYDRVA